MDELNTPGPIAPLSVGRLKAVGMRQWWVVAVCGLIATAAAAGYAEVRPLRYMAAIVIESGVQPLSTSQSGGTSPPSLPDPYDEASSRQLVDAASSAAGVSSSHVNIGISVSTDGTQIVLSATAPSPTQATEAISGAARAFVVLRVADINAEAASLQPELSSLAQQLRVLDAQAAAAGGASPVKGSSTSLPSSLSVEITVVTDQYSALYNQLVQVKLAAQAVRLAQGGPLQVTTVGNSKKDLLAMALGVGLVAGCGLALLRDLARDRLTNATEVGELSSLPLLAELPVRRLRRRETVPDAFGGQLGESVRELRTSLALADLGHPLKTLLVASAATGEGKSFVAANLALAWALAGARTVLVSSDLRHPTVEALLGVRAPGDGDLPQVLSYGAIRDGSANPNAKSNGIVREAGEPGDESLVLPTNGGDGSEARAKLLVPTLVDGLSVVPSGPAPANPAELLGSRAMAETMMWLRDRADFIILDSPPVLAVTDAMVLSGYVDGVLLVVTSGRSLKGNVRRTLRLLERGPAPVVGYVLNRAPGRGRRGTPTSGRGAGLPATLGHHATRSRHSDVGPGTVTPNLLARGSRHVLTRAARACEIGA